MIDVAVEQKVAQEKHAWTEWLMIGVDRRERKVALKELRMKSFCANGTTTQKKNETNDLLAQFEVDDKLIDKFSANVDLPINFIYLFRVIVA